MQVWTVANQKGGVGKTTTTLALGGLLAARGLRVLLVDMDPHASLSHLLDVAQEPPPAGSFDLFTESPASIDSLLTGTPVVGMALLAAQPALATLEKRSVGRAGVGQVLARALAAPRDTRFDHVLLDCPPTLGVLMVNALAACDRLLIPTQTEPLAVHGLDSMVRTARMVERSRGRALPFDVIPTLHDRRPRIAQEALESIRQRHVQDVFDDVVPLDTRLREPAHLLAGRPQGTRGLAAYAEALDWVLARNRARQCLESAA